MPLLTSRSLQAKEAAAGGLDPNLVPLGERAFAAPAAKQEIPSIEWWDAVVFVQPNYEPGEDGRVLIKDVRVPYSLIRPLRPDTYPILKLKVIFSQA